jgi:MerR family transcriptional regulator, light-induced transcriptional regulator
MPTKFDDAQLLSISAVERETGLSKDTLRAWERRYGFPTPLRDAKGDRRYSMQQVERLRKIKRLVDHGFRPSKVIGTEARSDDAPRSKKRPGNK